VLFRNTLAQSAPLVTGYLFSVIVAPVMLSQLGVEQFAVWAVTGALAMYAALLELGMTRSLSRFVALYETRGDERGIREAVTLGLIVVSGLFALTAGAAFLAAPAVVDLLGQLDEAEMRVVLMSSVSIFAFHAYRAVINSIPLGLRRMAPPNIAMTIGNFVNLGASLAALLIGDSLGTYALANVGAELCSLLLCVGALRVVWPRSPFALPSGARVRTLLSYGWKAQVTWLADLVNFETDKLIIAVLLDLRAVAAFEIGARVTQAVRAIAILSISAMIPTSTALIEKEGVAAIPPWYRRYTRYVVGLTYPLFVLVAVSAPFLLGGWLGDPPEGSVTVVVVLCFAFLIAMTTGVASTTALAEGRAGMIAVNAGMTAVLNVVLPLALAPLLELWGVVLGTLVANLIGSVHLTARFHRAYGVPARDFAWAALPPLVVVAAVGAPFAALAIAVGVPDARGQALLLLAGPVAVYTCVYWLLAVRFGFLPERLTRSPVARRRVEVGS
jgi:O-antigen/teichoic acid export membrane protein